MAPVLQPRSASHRPSSQRVQQARRWRSLTGGPQLPRWVHSQSAHGPFRARVAGEVGAFDSVDYWVVPYESSPSQGWFGKGITLSGQSRRMWPSSLHKAQVLCLSISSFRAGNFSQQMASECPIDGFPSASQWLQTGICRAAARPSAGASAFAAASLATLALAAAFAVAAFT